MPPLKGEVANAVPRKAFDGEVFFAPCPARRGSSAPSGAGDFFAAEKVTKKPPKPMVLESFGDADSRFGDLAGFWNLYTLFSMSY